MAADASHSALLWSAPHWPSQRGLVPCEDQLQAGLPSVLLLGTWQRPKSGWQPGAEQ